MAELISAEMSYNLDLMEISVIRIDFNLYECSFTSNLQLLYYHDSVTCYSYDLKSLTSSHHIISNNLISLDVSVENLSL